MNAAALASTEGRVLGFSLNRTAKPRAKSAKVAFSKLPRPAAVGSEERSNPAQAQLVARLREKDPKAFEQLIEQHGTKLYRVAARMVGRQEAEEVLQDTLLTVVEKIHTFEERAALGTWLYRLVLNTALLRLRFRAREESRKLGELRFTEAGEFQKDIPDWALPPEDALLRQESVKHLQEAIDQLPGRYRSVYVLAEIEGLRLQEVAGVLDLTLATVKTRLHRARLVLREELEAYLCERPRRP